MRLPAVAFWLALCACGPPAPAEPASQGAATGPTAPDDAPVFALEPEALTGRWSFDRSCGLYDLVFNADGTANYYDYADESHVVSYAGRWATADHNRVVLTLRQLNDSGDPGGDSVIYTLDVADPVADDLIGQFGPSGGDMRAISAKRCSEEDRD